MIVNNAGKSIRRAIDRSYDRFHDFTRTADLNYLGPVRLLLALLPAMRERGSGHVVNVSTVGVLLPPTPRWSAYQASKAAFDVWLRAVAAETHADGVTATSLYMALVHTRMSAPTDDFKLVPGLSPDEAAGLVCHAIVDRPSAITPWWVTTAALIDVAARGTSDRLVRLYAKRFTSRGGGVAPGASAAPRRTARRPPTRHRPATSGAAREPLRPPRRGARGRRHDAARRARARRRRRGPRSTGSPRRTRRSRLRRQPRAGS